MIRLALSWLSVGASVASRLLFVVGVVLAVLWAYGFATFPWPVIVVMTLAPAWSIALALCVSYILDRDLPVDGGEN